MRVLGSPAVGREPLPSGKSGARLERVRLADGRSVIVKWMRPRGDWQMRATRDPGIRDALVFRSGLLHHLPSPAAHPILEVIGDCGDEVGLVMRDVTEGLLQAGRRVTRAEIRRLLEATSAMHRALRDVEVAGLCSPEDRYLLLSPDVVAEASSEQNAIRRRALAGWARFFQMAPAGISDAVTTLHGDIRQLTSRLQRFPTTIIHGDLHFANVAMLPNEVVLLDWGLLTTRAPASTEFAYFLMMRNHHAPAGATLDELVAEYLAVAPETPPGELALALLGSVVMFGWALALRAVTGPAGDEELRWWLDHAAAGLDEL